MEIFQKQIRAPEIYGDYWFNSDPITIGALRGYPILVDFWDYTSIKWLRTLPYIKEWHSRYFNKGLVTIGVHTPQFPFTRDPINVRKAIEKLHIKYPIVMDNNYFIWNLFRAIEWPTKYLIDKHGFIRYAHFGEGQYQNIEQSIQSLIVEAGYHAELPLIMQPLRDTDIPGAICYRETKEILTGWHRGTIGNIEGYSPESVVHYEDPHYYIEGRLYLHGDWFNERNFIKLHTNNPRGGYITFIYNAKEVYAVIKPEGEKGFQVFIHQDDQNLTKENFGKDISFDEEGRSFIIVNEAKLYNIINNTKFEEHKLTLSTRSNGFAIYSISFVTSVVPELTPYY